LDDSNSLIEKKTCVSPKDPSIKNIYFFPGCIGEREMKSSGPNERTLEVGRLVCDLHMLAVKFLDDESNLNIENGYRNQSIKKTGWWFQPI